MSDIDIFSYYNLVKKVCYYTRTPFEEGRYLYNLVALAEEAKIKVGETSHKLSLEIGSVKDQLNNFNSQVIYNSTYAAELAANINLYNRCADYLILELKKIIRPVWGVYWGEACTSVDIIKAWVLKADDDDGVKVFAKLDELEKNK